ncbi:hypothetical protein [Pseudarcicella hirudinis]|nr:hypothetical protein [Pseudarcicella hirudinis]
MMKLSIGFFAVFLFLWTFTACKKETIIEVERKTSWQLNENYLYEERIQMNSYADGDALYTVGANSFSKITVNKTDTSKLNIEFPNTPYSYQLQYKYPISARVSIGLSLTNSQIGFLPIKWPGGENSATISMKDQDPAFYHFDFPEYWQSECIGINNLDQCLIPYQAKESGASNALKFMAVNLKVSKNAQNGFDKVEASSVKRIKIDNNTGAIISLHTINNFFYITCANMTLRISPDLKVNIINKVKFYRIFSLNGAIYGFTESQLYKSTDNGLNWVSIASNIANTFSKLNYYLIGGKICGAYNSQIFIFEFANNQMTTRELANDGIGGNTITSISEFNKKIFVTTLSGVFTKKSDKFLTYK